MLLARGDVPQDIVDHAGSPFIRQAAGSGKPEAIQEKMAYGRLEEVLQEYVILSQAFVKDRHDHF